MNPDLKKILFPEIIEVRHEPENMEFDGEYQAAREDDRDVIKVLAIFRNNRTD